LKEVKKQAAEANSIVQSQKCITNGILFIRY